MFDILIIPIMKGYCQEGECRTHSDQCKELWNGGMYP